MCENKYDSKCQCHSKYDKEEKDEKPKKKTMKEIFKTPQKNY